MPEGLLGLFEDAFALLRALAEELADAVKDRGTARWARQAEGARTATQQIVARLSKIK